VRGKCTEVENAMLQGGKAKRKPAETMIDNRGKGIANFLERQKSGNGLRF